jgi:hypothetical protein
VGRLDFAPKIDDIKVTDVKKGLGSFTPRPDKAASFAALKAALKKAGYTLASAEINVAGILKRDDAGWWVEVETSRQRFAIEGDDVSKALGGATDGDRLEITGDWQTAGTGATSREVIRPRVARKLPLRGSANVVSKTPLSPIQVSLTGVSGEPQMFFSPIRTTTPGLTVYKGGAVVADYSFTRQHLGNLKVDRQMLRLAVSYTPTPTLQLAAEVPYARTAFDSGLNTGSAHGLGNITLWGKYRFYRSLETWGDRQAAVRFGLELPTGKKSAPGNEELQSSGFVREQLTPINGGLSFHADTAYSQAKGRFIYGANIEAVLRGDRAGFRLGHEVRVNTDLEYVLLPFKYRGPTKELFTILETTFIHQGRGRLNGAEVPGSNSTEFYVSPALQYVATARLVLEASYQFPVVRNTGPQVLRTDSNLLIGIKYLY